MKPQEILLSDYQKPEYDFQHVNLCFKLDSEKTIVSSNIKIRCNKNNIKKYPSLLLNGKDLKLISLALDDIMLDQNSYKLNDDILEIPSDKIKKSEFTLKCITEINPKSNSTLEGLYLSNEIYCTQCEPEGFRKITYFLDRPDVMTKFKVKIEGNYKFLLSNGNLLSSGKGWAEWNDPWPKPSYLFALVAGNLKVIEDEFFTITNKKILLQIYVEEGNENNCEHAMSSIKKCMKWDEDVYGREYDLERFMIVAINDFNMGAMENKGLNIFNSKYILANKKTATDMDFELIERIIAHEYFHNWTGNRITCRDWFQLCLKEGLTVFRDQQFSADMQNKDIVRIDDVALLRSKQFREDAGPLRHPVRPEKYSEINNFYTTTVYEKGAEVIRMLSLIIGEKEYYKAIKSYFDKHDGEAITVEDWIRIFEKSTGKDLKQFFLWYIQSGTPVVKVEEQFESGNYIIKLTQILPAQNNNVKAKPMVIPTKVSFIDYQGEKIKEDKLMVLNKKTQNFMFTGFKEKPIAVYLCDFSAPIKLESTHSLNEHMIIMNSNSNSFCIWDSTQKIFLNLAQDIINGTNTKIKLDEILNNLLLRFDKNHGFLAKLLTPPSEEEIAVHMLKTSNYIIPENIDEAREKINQMIAGSFKKNLINLYDEIGVISDEFNNINTGLRLLKNRYLDLIVSSGNRSDLVENVFYNSTNMTEILNSLKLLVKKNSAKNALSSFYKKWEGNPLLIDKWFSVQATFTTPSNIFKTIERLSSHPNFNFKNPNRFRSLISSFAFNNHKSFHSIDGRGYEIVASWIKKMDEINPQIAARLSTSFETMHRIEPKRKLLMKTILKGIRYTKNLSKDTLDITDRILNT
ncbi:MAG: aminopeptidase N [Paracoccaceae bacterium]